MLVGWALGMFFAPYSKKEQDSFSKIAAAISAFVSGYIVSKFDRFLESSLFGEEGPDFLSWLRAGLFFSALALAMLSVFSNRLYFGAPDPNEEPTQNPDFIGPPPPPKP